MRLARPFFLAPLIYREALFRIDTTEKILLLSFDDGPYPENTLRILETIEKWEIMALFFCTGTLAESNTSIIERIKQGGHTIGNHGYEHLSGFRTGPGLYLDNINAAATLTSSKIFRPPYGQITPSQYKIITESYKVIFWDVMAYDFDLDFGWVRSLELLKRKIRPGSVIVLHDKPLSTTLLFLDRFISYAITSGFRFIIPDELKLQE